MKSKELYTYIENLKIEDKHYFLKPEKSDKHETLVWKIVVKKSRQILTECLLYFL